MKPDRTATSIVRLFHTTWVVFPIISGVQTWPELVEFYYLTQVPTYVRQGHRNWVFSNVEPRDWRMSGRFTCSLAYANQKLGFPVIGSNLRCLNLLICCLKDGGKSSLMVVAEVQSFVKRIQYNFWNTNACTYRFCPSNPQRVGNIFSGCTYRKC